MRLRRRLVLWWGDKNTLDRASILAAAILGMWAVFLATIILSGCARPTPPPTPIPDGTCCLDPNPNDSGWSIVAKEPAYNALFLAEEMEADGPSCGRPFEETLTRLKDRLSVRGICSGIWKTKLGLMVVRPDGKWEQWDLLHFDSGCWRTLADDSTYVATWRGPSLGCNQ